MLRIALKQLFPEPQRPQMIAFGRDELSEDFQADVVFRNRAIRGKQRLRFLDLASPREPHGLRGSQRDRNRMSRLHRLNQEPRAVTA